MWCDKCKADVAAMASADTERLYCTTCGSDLPRPTRVVPAGQALAAPAARKSLSDPRELLARWAREDALGSLDLSAPVKREPAVESRMQLRFDAAHPTIPPQTNFAERPFRQGPSTPQTQPPAAADMPARDVVIHPPHGVNRPHFEPAPVPLADKSSRWVTTVGQMCAYFGVGGLFIGTVLVLMGYFAGPSSYVTTGWLVTTAGQMLLFLGVITLVSGGMEQTTQEVARRIDSIGQRLIRIENATSLHGSEGRQAEDTSI